jgi:hypothetical protein
MSDATNPSSATAPKAWSYIIVALLAAVTTLAASFMMQGTLLMPALGTAVADANSVGVFDVVMDREGRSYLDILFDRPLGRDHEGEIVALAPARFEPRIEGVWKWRSNNILRFEPAAPFPIATQYKVTLLAERLLEKGQRFRGDTEFTVQTDPFLVEKVTTVEEEIFGEYDGEGNYVGSSGAALKIRGDIHFNYDVSPEMLATRLQLFDPALGDQLIGIELTTMSQGRVISFRTVPLHKEKEERTLRLVISKDMAPAEGNVPLGSDYTHRIVVGSRENLTIRSYVAQAGETESSIRMQLSSSVDAAIAAKFVTVSPVVPVRISTELNQLVVTGAFKPGDRITVTVNAGLPARDGSTLQKAWSETIVIPDLEPSVAFESEGMFLSATGYKTVNLESINVPEVTLAVDRVYRNNLFFLFDRFSYEYEDDSYYGDPINHSLGDRIYEETLPLTGEKNRTGKTPIRLGAIINDREPGIYRVGVMRTGEWRGTERWVLITDLGIVAKRGAGGFLVWVSSFKNLAAVADAEVTLVSSQNQTLAKGRTDGNGIWRADDLGPVFEKKQPYMVVVEKGGDFSFALLDQSLVDTSGFDVGGDSVASRGYSAYLYGERDIYRPGEIVEGVAVVRDRMLQAPSPMPLVLRHRDPQGSERGDARISMNGNGIAPFTVAIPDYSRTGNHTLELIAGEEIIGRYRFQVEEFVPDRIKVEITPQKKTAAAGEPLVFGVESAYLFGPPAAGLAVESRVRLTPMFFTAKGFEAYTFHNAERKFDDREVLNEEATLDENGRKEFSLAIPTGLQVPSALEAVITSRVREQGGRGVAALARVPIHPYPYYIGLRSIAAGYAEISRPYAVEYVAVDNSGRETKAGGIRAEFFLDRWQTVLRKVPGGGYRYESTRDPQLVTTQNLAAGQSRGRVSFTPRSYGSYRVVLTDPATGASSQVEFYAAGWGYSPWAIRNPGRLELDLDKKEYAPGETATLQVRAPFGGKLLVTVERDDVFHTEVHTMTGNTAAISVPIRGEYRPNAYITATLVRAAGDLSPGEAGRAYGTIPVSVDRESNRLKVAVTTPQEIRPRTKLTIDVAAEPGASVTIAAVDEGILQLIAQKTPDPFPYFYRKLALGVSTYDIFSLLLPEVAPVQGKSPAGGGEDLEGLAQFVRTEGIRRTEPVAFWSGVVKADASGKATVSFDVPDFQGALRVMAVAHDGRKFGSSEKMTRVRDPLTLLPTFPRFLSFNERAQIPVTVRNDTGKDGTFAVAMTATGPVTLESGAGINVAVPDKREKTIYFTLQTRAVEGAVKLALTGSGNGIRTQAGTDLGIRPDLPPQSVDRVGSFQNADTALGADETAQFLPQTVTRTLRISPLPVVHFASKLEYLLHYPYGCVEQTTSSAFPLIYFADLAKELDPKLFAKSDPASYVRAGIRRLATMQLYSGGFGMWPGSDQLEIWPSIYATHFLVEARRGGHLVENFLYDRAIEFLQSQIRAKQTYGSRELQETVYALYVLARAGKPDLGTMDFIRERHFKALTAESRGLLAAAYASVGNRNAVDQLIREIQDVENVARETGGSFNSTIRNRALLLLSLLDIAPADPRVPRLIDRLARDANFGWTTQESGFVFVAVGQFFRQQASKGPYAGTVFVGDKPLATFTNKTIAVGPIGGNLPIRVKMNQGYAANAAYFALMTRGVPTDAAFKPTSAGLEISRDYLTREGNPLPAEGVQQGDLLVVRVRVRSLAGALENVVVSNLLPSGIEVENPRLQSTEALPWIQTAGTEPEHLDVRDDRVLFFVDLPQAFTEYTFYTLVRAVTPGSFKLPPAQAEAMYNPAIRATGPRGTLNVKVR